MRRNREVAMADVHHDGGEIDLLHGRCRVGRRHPADIHRADLDSVRNRRRRRRAVRAGEARANADGADDEAEDEAGALGHGSHGF